MKKYWDEPYVLSFESKVIDRIEEGERLGLVLEETYFFPEGGGQPSDQGTIASHPVLDVQEIDDVVMHYVERQGSEDLEVGTVVACEINEDYRLHNMRTHSACHVLFGAAAQLFPDVAYAGFHISELGNLYLETDRQIRGDELLRIQQLANECVVEDRPVTVYRLDEEDATEIEELVYNVDLPEGTVRVVAIEDWDVAACCGTHVRSTIEVGPIKVLARESHKKNVTRIDYAIGKRAVAEINREDEVLTATAEFLSTSKDQVGQIVRKLSEDLREAEKEAGKLREELTAYKAQELLEGGEEVDGVRLIVGAASYLDQAAVRKMVAKVTSEHDSVVAAVIGGADRLAMAAGCSDDVDVNLSPPIVDIAQEYGGGGGGSPSFVNAGGMAGSIHQVRDKVENALRALLQDA